MSPRPSDSDAPVIPVPASASVDAPSQLAFPVEAIGGSTGGLEALLNSSKRCLPTAAWRLSGCSTCRRKRESLIAELLSKRTRMVVREIEDGIRVAPNHVYTIRPGQTLTIRQGVLHLGDTVEKPVNRRPIDDFFRSLAEAQHERVIAIVMSGMGSNGTAGEQTIKATGGLCIAQDPESTKFPPMARTRPDHANSRAGESFRK